jgi:outer membrane autotransporter protein
VANEALTSDAGDTLNSRSVNLGDFSHSSFVGGLAAGYDFFPRKGWPLRAEIEFLARSYKDVTKTHSSSLNATIGGNALNTLIRVNERSKIGIHTALLNVYYDFHNDSQFTPFLGAGAGIAVLHGKLKNAVIAAPDMNPPVEFDAGIDDDAHYGDAQFAWGLNAGVNYALNADWSLDLGYKYTNAGNNSYTSGLGSVGLETKLQIHDILLGCRYTF